MKRTVLGVGLAALLALAFGPAVAQQAKKLLAIVVKGLDNPFFEQINLGCQKWQAENPDADTPASTPALPPAPTRPARCRSSTICSTGRRRDRHLAVERAGHGQPAQRRTRRPSP